jgi:hypothetical protein
MLTPEQQQQIKDQITVNLSELEIILSHGLNLIRVTKELKDKLDPS